MKDEKSINVLQKEFSKIECLKELVENISYELPRDIGECSLLKKQLHYNSTFDLISEPIIKLENPIDINLIGSNVWVYVNNFVLRIELNNNIYDVKIDIRMMYSKNFLIHCKKHDFAEILISKLKNAIYVILSDTNKKTDTIQYRGWSYHIVQIYNYEILKVYKTFQVKL